MKQLFCSLIGTVRYYSSGAASQQPKWKKSKFSKNKYKKSKSGATTPRKPKIQWTDEQSKALRAIRDGKSVFISGSAGTGKTALVEHVIKELKKNHGRSQVFVTASTGVAACAINGLTLHSFAGIGLADVDRETLLSRVFSDRKAYRRWNKAKVLVIDEISMISAEYFDMLEYIARLVRDGNPSFKRRVWGGLQLVVSGDFYQLPPIIKKNKKDETKDVKVYAFEADCWDESFDLQIVLPLVFRQSEPTLVKVLQGIRKGVFDPEDLKLLEQRSCLPEEDPSAVQLFPRIVDVNRVNKKCLLDLGERITVYTALDTGEESSKKQLKSGIVPDQLELCIGARVMLCKNINIYQKLVNGATGTVIDFHDLIDAKSQHGVHDNACRKHSVTDMYDGDLESISSDGKVLPVVKFDFGDVYRIGLETWVVMDGDTVVAKRRQIPLMLAWALSIHKCQGMTIDRLHTDLSRAFGNGMVYVALSRVRTLDGLHLSGLNPKKIQADPKVKDFYERISSLQDKHYQDASAYYYKPVGKVTQNVR
ncbi:OLC1v1023596C1 [Oldenlandia corymbosa var. corymbosa]|uniref:ATP-dependent DNA helicase n=1 Tax=Oldenlandia corymbosa var. corymbosa TaxID=529605 RepID=A0AAV1C1Q1_OLDCO|nr:OLC1v1023596C1 [Oldenlandia corymbosa var. corymbosa]